MIFISYLNHFVRFFSIFLIGYVITLSFFYLLQMIMAILSSPAYIKKSLNFEYDILGPSVNMIPFSVLVPAYNEESTIVESVKSMLNLDYSNYEVIVINDGSKDNTFRLVIEAFNLQKIFYPVRGRLSTKHVRDIYHNPDIPRLYFIDKENGGKSDALNAGLNLSRYPYIVSVDADSLLQSDALLRIAMVFIQNKHTIAAGGIIRVVNGCEIKDGKVIKVSHPKRGWALFQTVEYFRAFLIGRIGWSSLNSLIIISGAFGAFQKEHVLAVGGYTVGTIGEDMELVIKLHRYMRNKNYKYRVAVLPDPICWTQVPETFNVLYRQRRRWHIGLMDVLWRSRDMFFKRKYGILGFIILPYYLLFEMLAPIVELLGHLVVPLAWYFGFLSWTALILFGIASIIFFVISSIGSLAVEVFINSKHIKVKELIKLTFYSIFENLFYRQLMVAFRLIGTLAYHKNKNEWGKMKRQKFSKEEELCVS